MISVQLSNSQLQPLLYTKVIKYMLYIVNKQYSKCFPKDYKERIDWTENSYLLYTRPDSPLLSSTSFFL